MIPCIRTTGNTVHIFFIHRTTSREGLVCLHVYFTVGGCVIDQNHLGGLRIRNPWRQCNQCIPPAILTLQPLAAKT